MSSKLLLLGLTIAVIAALSSGDNPDQEISRTIRNADLGQRKNLLKKTSRKVKLKRGTQQKKKSKPNKKNKKPKNRRPKKRNQKKRVSKKRMPKKRVSKKRIPKKRMPKNTKGNKNRRPGKGSKKNSRDEDEEESVCIKRLRNYVKANRKNQPVDAFEKKAKRMEDIKTNIQNKYNKHRDFIVPSSLVTLVGGGDPTSMQCPGAWFVSVSNKLIL